MPVNVLLMVRELNIGGTERQCAEMARALDRRRYVSSMLNNRGALPPGELDRALSRFRREEYAKLIWPATRKAMVRRIQHKIVQWREQMAG